MVWLISFTFINPTLSFYFRYPHNLSQLFGVHVSNMKRLKLCACGDSTPYFFPLRGTDFISGKPSFSMKIALIQFTKFNTEVILSKTKIIVLRQLWIAFFWIWFTCQIKRLLWHFALKKQQQFSFVLLYLLCRRAAHWKRFHNSAIRKNTFHARSYSNVRKRRLEINWRFLRMWKPISTFQGRKDTRD